MIPQEIINIFKFFIIETTQLMKKKSAHNSRKRIESEMQRTANEVIQSGSRAFSVDGTSWLVGIDHEIRDLVVNRKINAQLLFS